ncbi:MAG: alpha-N-arabinofuranosidase [Microthrixaceae bacterium]
MDTTTVRLHPAFTVAPVDERIFGGFLEHLGRAVYGGVHDPTSAHADEFGNRSDVLAALDRLRMTVMRWPGGNFTSGYHWSDGIGPAETRPVVRDPAWRSAEPNTFGTHEFLDLAERVAWTPMLAVNLGTGTPEEAADWVEYCNAPTGTRWADERAANGRAEPWRVPLWCLGNEMDGPWQLGHAPVEEYGRLAQQAAMQMKLVDRGIETIACGSSNVDLPSYGTWDRRVLELLGDDVDHLSVHRYVGDFAGDLEDYLAVGASVDRQIREVDGICRAVQAARKSPRRAHLCFDEWNVWYRNFEMDGNWQQAPHLLEEVYDLADALVVAQFLLSFVRHADVVKIANLAQVVNVIAPLLTRDDDLLVQTIFHPFRMVSDRRSGTSLRVALDGPTVTTRSHGTVPVIDTAAIADGDTVHVFTVNRSTDAAAPVRIEVPGAAFRSCRAELLAAPSTAASNTWDAPDAVQPVEVDTTIGPDGAVVVELPPHSFLAASAVLGG